MTGWPERSSRTKQPESSKARRWNNARKRIRSRVPHSSTGSHSGPRKTKLQQKANHRGKALSRRESQGEPRLMEQAAKGEPSQESLIPERIPGRTPVNGTSNGRRTSARKFHSGENGAFGKRLGRPWGMPWEALGTPSEAPESLLGSFGISRGRQGHPGVLRISQHGPTWGQLGANMSQHGPSWGQFGTNLEPTRATLGPI